MCLAQRIKRIPITAVILLAAILPDTQLISGSRAVHSKQDSRLNRTDHNVSLFAKNELENSNLNPRNSSHRIRTEGHVPVNAHIRLTGLYNFHNHQRACEWGNYTETPYLLHCLLTI